MNGALVFVHLSDIHFNKKWHDEFELDADVRSQLERDAADVRSEFDSVNGVLISGDVAFGGKADDYAVAREWLKRLCGIVGCKEQQVWCVPGNHDVDQSVYNNSGVIQMLHRDLRPAEPEEIDDRLTACMRDSVTANALLEPIQHYNAFASTFSCQSKTRPLTWHHDLKLNDGSVLRLYGINSTLVSHRMDKEKKLIVGTVQATPTEESGVVYLAICHHPPDWILDYEAMNHGLSARARIQLFGHKHFQRVDELNGCLRIGAGAVHPSRREKQWRPRYNWLEMCVRGADAERYLDVRVYPRVWNDARPEYIGDLGNCDPGKKYRTYNLKLPAWTPPPATAEARVPGAALLNGGSQADNHAEPEPGESMDAARTLTYRFLDLSHIVRLEIAQRLSLIENEDEGLKDFDLLERVMARAAERGQLEALWDSVEEAHGDNQNPTNPYIGM